MSKSGTGANYVRLLYPKAACSDYKYGHGQL